MSFFTSRCIIEYNSTDFACFKLLYLSFSTFYKCPWRLVSITIHASVTPTVIRSAGTGWWVTANSTRATATLRTSACTPGTAHAVEVRLPRVTTTNVTVTTTGCEISPACRIDIHHVSKTSLLSHLNLDYISWKINPTEMFLFYF